MEKPIVARLSGCIRGQTFLLSVTWVLWTAVMCIPACEAWKKAERARRPTGVISVHFNKTFDNASHGRLLMKIRDVDVDNCLLRWIADVLRALAFLSELPSRFNDGLLVVCSKDSFLVCYYSWFTLMNCRQFLALYVLSLMMISTYGEQSNQQPTYRLFRTAWVNWKTIGDMVASSQPCQYAYLCVWRSQNADSGLGMQRVCIRPTTCRKNLGGVTSLPLKLWSHADRMCDSFSTCFIPSIVQLVGFRSKLLNSCAPPSYVLAWNMVGQLPSPTQVGKWWSWEDWSGMLHACLPGCVDSVISAVFMRLDFRICGDLIYFWLISHGDLDLDQQAKVPLRDSWSQWAQLWCILHGEGLAPWERALCWSAGRY